MRHYINMLINSIHTKPRPLSSRRKSINIPHQVPVLNCVRIPLHDVSHWNDFFACEGLVVFESLADGGAEGAPDGILDVGW